MNAAGDVTHILHRVKDVTTQTLDERSRLETASELRLGREIRDLIHLIPVPIAIFRGPEHRYSLVNPAHDRLLGKSVEGQTIREAHFEDEADVVFAMLDRVYETLEPMVTKENRYAITGRDGVIRVMWINEWFYPFHDAAGNIAGILACAQDVSEQVEARRIAEGAYATKSTFLANMSHEIRTPLGAILGFSALLKERDLDLEERDQFVDTIIRNGNALIGIIDDILDLTKVEAGKLNIETLDFPLHDLVRDAVDLFENNAKQKRVGLHLTVDTSAPEWIRSDPTRLRQILINLIGNAVKFTHEGEICVAIRSTVLPDGKAMIAIEVKDSGIGLTEEEKAILFQPFVQADDSTTRKFGGTGLGLALSQRLCHALGGEISIGESAPGAGCTFIVTFTAAVAARAQYGLPRVAALEAQPASLAGLRILIVDDSPENQLLVARVLSRGGAQVETAPDGQKAFEKAQAGSFDVILMDIQMPLMDGYQAKKALDAIGYRKPVIALTASAMSDDVKKTEAAGFAGHMTKPLVPAELIRVVAQFRKDPLR